MASSWKTEYLQEPYNFLIDNGKLVEQLYFRIEALTKTEGVPSEGAHQEEPGIIWWEVEGHLVIYQRIEALKLISVEVIKPLR